MTNYNIEVRGNLCLLESVTNAPASKKKNKQLLKKGNADALTILG